ncbi:transcription termination factor MTERF4, chloroplastic [Impatiens glandulifera]|uniref:transcription termination factor MTERF4, chloroplastic n=1 Tax=Impatiens glandulifera TaxID=253017 RepID=UPI001FB13F08|nr:transcription termination factor MTERF4, chloroplastic [Impatiens glandulifera]
MRMIINAGIAKPSFFVVQYELPTIIFHQTQLIPSSTVWYPRQFHNRNAWIAKFKCSIAERSSPSFYKSKYPHPKREPKRERGNPTSLYSRPSLLDMKKEKMEKRALVYDFLRSIGIIPDELDGLELPVTVDVMKDRVEFLDNIGLTIDDINNYPLILGCSVKKNMIPVLDYLGKLGVRKSTFTDFLRRYPQILQASVVIDLEPVVKYLQGMDIKPNDIPRVLERYPEVLGFKLEGTMSTSVAYLVGIGVSRREIGGVLTKYPEILGMRVGRIIKPFVEYLEYLGIPELAVARLIENRPHILGFDLGEKVKPNVESLLEYNVKRTGLASVIAQYPEMLGLDLKQKLISQSSILDSILGLGVEDFGRVIEKMPQVVSLSKIAVEKHVGFLKSCGFSIEQARDMVMGCPQLLALNLDAMKLGFEFFKDEMGRDLNELVGFPAFFTYGLESVIKPRHKVVAKKGLKCSLAWLLNCSDQKFEERMKYDFIDMEDNTEEDYPLFDMKTLMEPETDDESESEFEDESEIDDE